MTALPLRSLSLLAAMTGAFLLAGCPKSGETTDDAAAAEPSGTVQTADAATLSPVGRTSDRTTPAGRWLLLMIRGNQVLPAAIVTIEPTAEPPLSLSDRTQFAPDWAVESAEINGGEVDATLTRDGGTVELDLALRDGRLDGAADFGGGAVAGAQLIAWDAKTIDDPNLNRPPPGFQRMEALMRDKDATPEQAYEMAAAFAGSPVARELKRFALLRTIENAVKERRIELAEAQAGSEQPADPTAPVELRNEAAAPAIRAAVDKYLAESAAWGDEFAARATIGAMMDLVSTGQATLEEVDRLAAKAASYDVELTPNLRFRREAGPLIQAVAAGERVDEAKAFVATHEKDFPFNNLLYRLRGDLAARTETREDDLRYAGELAALSGTAPDFESFAAFYQDVNGTAEGADTYLEDRFLDAIARVAGEPVFDPASREVPDGEVPQVPVVEMFTSSNCEPCVATDVALSAIHRAYGDDVIIMREHIKNMGPDALASFATAAREEFYNVEGTPMVFLNGLDINPKRERGFAGMYGPITNAPAAYDFIESRLLPELARTTPIQIDASAEFDDQGRLVVEIEATGHPTDPVNPALRLAIALVEKELRIASPNGVLVHDNVLRQTPANPYGLPPRSDGRLFAEGPVPIDSIRTDLLGYLETDEVRLLPGPRRTVMEMDDLHMVVFVQNIETKQVLQAKVVPITGQVPPIPEDIMNRPYDPGVEDSADEMAKAGSTPDAPAADMPQADESAADAALPSLDDAVADQLRTFSEAAASAE